MNYIYCFLIVFILLLIFIYIGKRQENFGRPCLSFGLGGSVPYPCPKWWNPGRWCSGWVGKNFKACIDTPNIPTPDSIYHNIKGKIKHEVINPAVAGVKVIANAAKAQVAKATKDLEDIVNVFKTLRLEKK